MQSRDANLSFILAVQILLNANPMQSNVNTTFCIVHILKYRSNVLFIGLPPTFPDLTYLHVMFYAPYIQFGHNDAGDINKGKARAELPGSGDESKVFKMENDARYKVVYTFGWYLRKFILDVKEKGAIPIVLSHTPRNQWDNGQIGRNTNSFGKWTREAAEASGAYFIDLNKITADKLQQLGYEKGLRRVGVYFNTDHTHTSLHGAHLNAESIVEGLKASDCLLKNYVR